MCAIGLPVILLKMFDPMFIMDIGLKFSFLAESLPGFDIRIILVL